MGVTQAFLPLFVLKVGLLFSLILQEQYLCINLRIIHLRIYLHFYQSNNLVFTIWIRLRLSANLSATHCCLRYQVMYVCLSNNSVCLWFTELLIHNSTEAKTLDASHSLLWTWALLCNLSVCMIPCVLETVCLSLELSTKFFHYCCKICSSLLLLFENRTFKVISKRWV